MPTNSNEYTRTWNPQKVGLEDDFPNTWQFVVSMLMLDAVYIKLYKYSTNMGGLPNGNSVLTHKINVDNRSVATLKSLRSGWTNPNGQGAVFEQTHFAWPASRQVRMYGWDVGMGQDIPIETKSLG